MKKMTLLSIIAVLGVLAIVGCSSPSGTSPFAGSFGGATGTGIGPAAVDLGSAAGINGGTFAILAKSGVTNVTPSPITGDIGVSPIDHTAVSGFSTYTADASNRFYTSGEVTGKIYAADLTAPTPTQMTTVISDMQTAYVDAAGRPLPKATELYAGDLSGRTLTPGLYKWSSGVLINTPGVTLKGGANDTWILQIAQDLTVGPGAQVMLSGGAQAKNIVWQVGGGVGVQLNTTSHFEGTILAIKAIVVKTGASVNGRLFAQTAVTLAQNTVVAP
jgi:hypothetical protein